MRTHQPLISKTRYLSSPASIGCFSFRICVFFGAKISKLGDSYARNPTLSFSSRPIPSFAPQPKPRPFYITRRFTLAEVLVGNLARFRDPSLEQKEVKRKPDGTKTDGLKMEVAKSNRENAK